jgi:hypothetical protein
VLRGDADERLGPLRTEQLIADAREGARDADLDQSALLPEARRLRQMAYYHLEQDARQAVQTGRESALTPGQERLVDGFEVSALEGGGYTAVHLGTELRTVFDEQLRWTSRAYLFADAPRALQGLKLVAGRASGGGLEYGLAGPPARVAQLDVAHVTERLLTPEHSVVITDEGTGHRYFFTSEGTLGVRDVWVGDPGQRYGLGYLRFHRGQPDGTPPDAVDAAGEALR